MKKRTTIFFFFLFLMLILCSSFALGVHNYTEAGNYDNYFQQGTGFFNANLPSYTDYLASLSGISKQAPLVNDLDGDGVNEIIVLDGRTFRLYNNKELDIVDAYNLPMNENVSNFVTFDIDDDDYNEIIVATEVTEILYILEYNGTDFSNQTSYDLSGINHTSGEMMLKCGDVDRCLLLISSQEQISGGVSLLESDLYATAFNSTGLGVTLAIDESGSSTGAFCFPRIRTIAYADYDEDTTEEFIFTAIDLGGGDDDIVIYWVDILANNSIVLENSERETRTGDSGAVDGCVDGDIGTMFTAPLVFDADGFSSTGLETIVAGSINTQEFNMWSYDADGNNIDNYPNVWDASGELISNVFRVNVFTEGDNDDFCVMGYDDDANEIDVLCGSIINTYTFLLLPQKSAEFVMSIADYHNISRLYPVWNSITHSAQHSTVTTDGNNLNEIVSGYGILTFDWDTVYRTEVPPILSLDLIFENPKADSVLISVDAEKIGREDLLALTSQNLYYLDDEYANTPAEISEYSINPCLDSTWKTNTSVEIRMSIDDADDDLVTGRAMLYYDDDNQQNSSWGINVSAGTELSFNFEANKTISVGVLKMFARDTENQDDVDEITVLFSVHPNGVEFGDCITEVDFVTIDEIIEGGTGAECEVEEDCADGYLCVESECVAIADTGLGSAFEEVSGLTGLSKNIIWLMIMVIVAVAIWINGDFIKGTTDTTIVLGVIGFAELILLILGVYLGMISVGVLISIIVVTIVIVALVFRKIFFGGD